MSGSFYPYTFAGAETYLAAGRSKHQRKVAHNTRLFRVDDETIVMVQHSTPIITFHADGTRTLWLNGYNTPTTRKRFSKYARDVMLTTVPGSYGCEIAVGYTGEITAPKVQKCRSCKGVGKWMDDEHCGEIGWYYGSSDSNPLMCKGATTEYAVPYDLGEHNDWHAHWESRHLVPCEHGHTEEGKRHQSAPCSHGEYGRHKTGEHESSCYRCNGEGRTDYGSNPVPITISTGQAWRVDAEGNYLGTGSVPNGHWSASEGAVGGYWAKPYSPPVSKPKPHTHGSEIADRLAKVLPGINEMAKHPTTGELAQVRSIIVSLNDTERWSRERIADWLDTLDIDLRFPTPKENAA